MKKLILLPAFLLSINFCFAQKVEYGTFQFESFDSIYHKAQIGSIDTVIAFKGSEPITMQVLGAKDVVYRNYYKKFTYSFDKRFLKLYSVQSWDTTSSRTTFYDLRKDNTFSFYHNEKGTTFNKKDFLWLAKPNSKIRHDVIVHKDVRKKIMGFDCFKVEINDFIDGKLTQSTFLFVTNQISKIGNKMHWIAGVPEDFGVLEYEISRVEEKYTGKVRKTFVKVLSFDSKNPKLKKQLKKLKKIATPYKVK